MKTTVVLIVAFICFSGAIANEKNPLDPYADCILKSGVTEDTINKFYMNEKKYDVNDVTIRKFAECVYLKSNVLSENGDYNKKNLLDIINSNTHMDEATLIKHRKRVEICAPDAEKTLQGKAFYIATCVLEATPNEV